MCLGAVAAFPALWLSANSVRGIGEGSATLSFGCFFLFSLGRAWWHIRNRRVELHREWATRMWPLRWALPPPGPPWGSSTYLAGEAWIIHSCARVAKAAMKGSPHFA